MIKSDFDRDLLVLHHANGQERKAVMPVRDLMVAANYYCGSVAGNYSLVVKKYRKNLPPGIIVYGDLRGKRYKFIGNRVTNPENDLFNDQGVSDNWQDLDKVANLDVIRQIKQLTSRVEKLEEILNG